MRTKRAAAATAVPSGSEDVEAEAAVSAVVASAEVAAAVSMDKMMMRAKKKFDRLDAEGNGVLEHLWLVENLESVCQLLCEIWNHLISIAESVYMDSAHRSTPMVLMGLALKSISTLGAPSVCASHFSTKQPSAQPTLRVPLARAS